MRSHYSSVYLQQAAYCSVSGSTERGLVADLLCNFFYGRVSNGLLTQNDEAAQVAEVEALRGMEIQERNAALAQTALDGLLKSCDVTAKCELFCLLPPGDSHRGDSLTADDWLAFGDRYL